MSREDERLREMSYGSQTISAEGVIPPKLSRPQLEHIRIQQQLVKNQHIQFKEHIHLQSPPLDSPDCRENHPRRREKTLVLTATPVPELFQHIGVLKIGLLRSFTDKCIYSSDFEQFQQGNPPRITAERFHQHHLALFTSSSTSI